MSNANTEIARQGFEAFVSGNIPGFNELLDANVEWDHRGPDEVQVIALQS